MKKAIKNYLFGFVSAAVLVSGISYAASTTTLYDVVVGGVKIYVDGHKLNPTDANGNKVEPIIYNGTTYLPVRAVANAIRKPVYWDGPNYTVYLGDMDAQLPYPTEELTIDDNIGAGWERTNNLKDNLGNTYTRAINPFNRYSYEKICNMKFSSFKGTIYVKAGSTTNKSTQIVIKTDGKTVYTSPEITKITAPIHFDVDITGCYDLQISATDGTSFVAIGDAGFYQ